MQRRILGLILASFVSLSACDEVVYEVYEDIPTAQADQMMAKGWLPEWIPKDATNIHLRFDLDTNARSISFTHGNSYDERWPRLCAPARPEIVSKPRLRTRLFPRSIQNMEGVQDCVDLFAVRDRHGSVHMWANSTGLVDKTNYP